MQHNIALFEFTSTLAGAYDNLEQSQANPKDFARIKIFFRPLPWSVFNAPGFYSEQCYDYAPWDPYRQGLHRVSTKEGVFVVENFGYPDFPRLAGAGKDKSLLRSLRPDLLETRCGCSMHFRAKGHKQFVGEVEPGKKCFVPRDSRITYLVSEVELNETTWVSRDRGYDPETDQQIWGSEHGKLEFVRTHSFANFIQQDWVHRSSVK